MSERHRKIGARGGYVTGRRKMAEGDILFFGDPIGRTIREMSEHAEDIGIGNGYPKDLIIRGQQAVWRGAQDALRKKRTQRYTPPEKPGA